MFKSRRDREDERYYLLPGMGRGQRRHRRWALFYAILVGLAASALLGLLIYLANVRRPWSGW
jgi:hypothetical protein